MIRTGARVDFFKWRLEPFREQFDQSFHEYECQGGNEKANERSHKCVVRRGLEYQLDEDRKVIFTHFMASMCYVRSRLAPVVAREPKYSIVTVPSTERS